MNKLIIAILVLLIIINSLTLYIFFDISKFVCGYTGIADFIGTPSCVEKNTQRVKAAVNDFGDSVERWSKSMEASYKK